MLEPIMESMAETAHTEPTQGVHSPPYEDLSGGVPAAAATAATATVKPCRDLFRRIQIYTYKLQASPHVLRSLITDGFHWVRRIPQKYETITRNPTIGCLVEFHAMYYPGTVHVDSRAGRKLINRLSYF